MDYDKTAGGVLMPANVLGAHGHYTGQIIRDGRVIDEWGFDNLVVNEGLNYLNDVMFFALAATTTWYLGVFEGNYTPVATVTAATITAASTESTAYSETTRQAFTTIASAAQVTTNAAARATFTFNATKTIYGAFLASASAKSATAGKLFSAAQFAASKAVVSGDQLLLTYTFTSSSI